MAGVKHKACRANLAYSLVSLGPCELKNNTETVCDTLLLNIFTPSRIHSKSMEQPSEQLL